MSEENDGGPAFPEMIEVDGMACSKGGLTLRDWFAGQSLAGWWACSETHGDFENTASAMYQAADAMLKAREL